MYGVFREDGRSERAIFIVDKYGIIQYIDIHDIDHQPDNEVLKEILREIDPQITRQAISATEAKAPPQIPESGILLFCTPWCPGCRKARKWLKDRDLAFVEIDITKSVQAADKVKGWANGNRTTPTINVDGRIIVDWDELELLEALSEKGYLKKN